MTKNKIIDRLYKLDLVRVYGCKHLRKFNSDKQEDLVQECWVNICEIPEDTLLDLYNQGEQHLTAYIKRFVENQLSPTGKTRTLQKLLTTEIPVDFDAEITKEDDDEIPSKRFLIDSDIDTKLNEYEKRIEYRN